MENILYNINNRSMLASIFDLFGLHIESQVGAMLAAFSGNVGQKNALLFLLRLYCFCVWANGAPFWFDAGEFGHQFDSIFDPNTAFCAPGTCGSGSSCPKPKDKVFFIYQNLWHKGPLTLLG